jgi:2-oxoisovalerate dehydrogenase E1 component
LTALHPAFDWEEVARLGLISRAIDDLQEGELSAQGLVTYQFSAKGHELGQLLISQLLTYPADAASVYYRSRPFMLGTGLTPEEAMASDMARTGGISGGRDVGVVFNLPRRQRAMVIPMAGDVGSQYTPAAGYAQGLTYRVEELGMEDERGSITIVFGGDGSVATNGFWSTLTMATTLRLPLLFMIEDNGYAISVRSPLQTPGANIADNLRSFQNLQIFEGSGTRPAETADLIKQAVDYVRQWEGPALLRLTMPRLSGHSSVDTAAYKSAEEVQAERQRDPIPAILDYVVPALMSKSKWDRLAVEAEDTVRAASHAASQQPPPAPATALRHVYADSDQPAEAGGLAAEGIDLPGGSDTPQPTSPQRINFIEAIRRTMDHELSLNPRLLIFGEDVGEKGGVHAATLDLQPKYGERRVFDTSLSEEGIIGRAVGMAYAGLMPLPEIQFRKYADPATEQLNNCGTIRWRTNGRFAAPIVVRIPGGYRKIGDPWHSVTSEIVFAHAVGWKLAFPSNAEDAVGLLRTALRGSDPVIFFEHRAMLDASWARRPYPGDDYMLPFGAAKVIQSGDNLTIVSWGAMVERCEAAVRELESSAEIIDLRTIVPWDRERVLESVKHTARCLIVHEDIVLGGFGAEIAATIASEALMWLDAPVRRVAAPSVPVPFNTTLMTAVVPTVDRIRTAIEEILAY